MSPAGGVQMRRSSRDDSIHSNGSLTLYRNYQRTVLRAGAPLLLVTGGHDYAFLTPPAAGSTLPPNGALTDGHA